MRFHIINIAIVEYSIIDCIFEQSKNVTTNIKTMAKKVLVTGATGNIASLVIPQLLEEEISVRALVRDLEKASRLSDMGVELIKGDFEDTPALEKATENIDGVLAITAPGPQAVDQGRNILNAAKKNGNPYYVRISAIKAAPDAPQNNGRLHYQSDQDLMASGLPYTILRPHYFMQNMFMSVDTIKENGNMYYGMGDGKLGMVDVRDIADSAARILIDGDHEGKIYTPTGPSAITFQEIADYIGSQLGKPVNYVKISLDDVYNAIADAGWGEWGAEVMRGYSKAYSEGWGDFVTDDVEIVTGKPSRSFQQFYHDLMAPALK